MNPRFFGLLAATGAAALLGSCVEDPTATLRQGVSRVQLEYAYREVIVADSVKTFAVETDAGGNPLPPTATVTSCNPAIASVVPTSDFPLLRKGFYIRGNSYGTTCVVAAVGSLRDTTTVATFPASIVVTGGPDSLGSGASAIYTYEYRDRAGNPVAGVPEPSWRSSDTTRAKVFPTPLGTVRGRAPGLVTLTVAGIGSLPAGLSATKAVTVVTGTFGGALAPTSGSPGDTVTVTDGPGGAGFDGDTRVTVNNVRTFPFDVTASQLRFIVPGVGAAGPVDLLLTNMGPEQVAQLGSLTSNTAALADPYDGVNDDPLTAPVLTANGDYYVVMSGACADGGGGAGTDCDDWFRVTNNGGSAATVTVRVDWFVTAADVDVLMGTDPVDVYGYGCEDGCPGATGANPQTTSLSVPAGGTRYVWVNLYDAGGAASSIIRVRVSGLP